MNDAERINRNFAVINMQRHLCQNPRPGDGIVAGIVEVGKTRYIVEVYWTEGSNEDVHLHEPEGSGLVSVRDSKDNEMYRCMDNVILPRQEKGCVVSNSIQTRDIVAGINTGIRRFDQVLVESVCYGDQQQPETKISTLSRLNGECRMFISWQNQSGGSSYARHSVRADPGLGHCITTNAFGGKKPFEGAPLLFPLWGDIGQLAEYYWDALELPNGCGSKAVSLVVRFFDPYGVSRVLIREPAKSRA